MRAFFDINEIAAATSNATVWKDSPYNLATITVYLKQGATIKLHSDEYDGFTELHNTLWPVKEVT